MSFRVTVAQQQRLHVMTNFLPHPTNRTALLLGIVFYIKKKHVAIPNHKALMRLHSSSDLSSEKKRGNKLDVLVSTLSFFA